MQDHTIDVQDEQPGFGVHSQLAFAIMHGSTARHVVPGPLSQKWQAEQRLKLVTVVQTSASISASNIRHVHVVKREVKLCLFT